MAFNPFHGFRKHQKAIFAVLTIICMFVFILQFGRGDALERLGNLFGGGRGKGETVVKLYGRDFTEGDLTKLRQQRTLANELVFAAVQRAVPEAAKNVSAFKLDKSELDTPFGKAFAKPHEDASTAGFALSLMQQNSQQASQLAMSFLQHLTPDVLERDIGVVDSLRRTLPANPDERESTADRAKVLDEMAVVLKWTFWEVNGQKTKDSLYLGGSLQTQDLLDFEIWKHQADRLGIAINRADARRAVAREAGGHDLPKDFAAPWKDDAAFKGVIDRYKDVSEDQIVAAVADEFRVILAQDLLAGRTAGVPSLSDASRPAPDPATPYEFWDYFRRQRTTVGVRVLDMPVEEFLPQVTQSPPENELERLLEKYKGLEPAPERADPAFKEPRRFLAEYVTAKSDSPLYKEEATRSLAAEFLSVQLLAGGNASAADGGAASLAILAAAAHSLPSEFDAGYKTYLDLHAGELFVDPYTKKIIPPHDAVTAGALLLHIQSGSLPSGNPFTAAAGYAGSVAADARKADDRVSPVVGFLVLGLAADNALPSLLTGAAALPTPPPPEMVVDRVLRQIVEERAPKIVARNLKTFMEELRKVKSDKVKAREYIEKAVKDYGFQYYAMKEPLDQYALPDDPALKTAKETLERELLTSQGPRRTLWQELSIGSGLYDPSRMSMDLVFWRSEDKPAREPLALDDPGVREKVKAAWRLRVAKRLAREKAHAIADEVKSLSPVEADKVLHEAKVGAIFPLTRVARLVDNPSPFPGQSRTYSEYQIPLDRIPYPPDGLVETLLKLEKPGDSAVFQDRPERHFYVAVLDDRSEPTRKDFNQVYQDVSTAGKDQLWSQYFLAKHQSDFQQGLLRALREEAGPVDEKTGKLQFTSRDSDAKQGR